MQSTFKSWAIVYNPTKPQADAVAAALQKVLEKLGAKAQIHEKCGQLKGYDAAATIGGDGTLLGCVEAALAAYVPLVGVNLGKLGYLTAVGKDNMAESFEKIVAGKFVATPRMALKTTFPDGTIRYGLNDLVIKSAEYRLAELKVFVDGELVTEYDCDGLIFATPTGSTAYNLSAGGPILHVKADGIVMTPICAHSLTNRSVIFNSKSVLRVENAVKHPVHINVDGRMIMENGGCLPLQVRQATRKLITLEDPQRGYFGVLRQKLGW